MNNLLKFILITALCLLVQLAIGEFVNFHPLIYIVILPWLIIIIPPQVKQIPLMLISLCIGLLIDILSDGIIGLNAAALIGVGYLKAPVLSFVVNKKNVQSNQIISSETYGIKSFALICLILYSIFFIIYIGLDGLGYVPVLYSIMRFLLFVITNTIIAILADMGLSKQIL